MITAGSHPWVVCSRALLELVAKSTTNPAFSRDAEGEKVAYSPIAFFHMGSSRPVGDLAKGRRLSIFLQMRDWRLGIANCRS